MSQTPDLSARQGQKCGPSPQVSAPHTNREAPAPPTPRRRPWVDQPRPDQTWPHLDL